MSKEDNPIFKVGRTTVAALTEVEEEMRVLMRNPFTPEGINVSEGDRARAGSTLVEAIMAKHQVHMSMFEMSAMAQAYEEQSTRERLLLPPV